MKDEQVLVSCEPAVNVIVATITDMAAGGFGDVGFLTSMPQPTIGRVAAGLFGILAAVIESDGPEELLEFARALAMQTAVAVVEGEGR